mmetsp:Transcript_84981/g.134236  ORF Transcript_84981/g.134236 Transcript_84981/m.134236 type:complete len:217 (+) Transcript_84981:56-706(+)
MNAEKEVGLQGRIGGHVIWGTPEPSNESGSGSKSDSSEIRFRTKDTVREMLQDSEIRFNSYSDISGDTSENSGNGDRAVASVEIDPCVQVQQSQSHQEESPPTQESWSALHASGQCKPCRFIVSKHGCIKGGSCTYCHYAHSRPSRPWKSKRDQCKLLAQRRLEDSVTKGPEELQKAAELLSGKGGYMCTVVQGKVNDMQQELASRQASSSGKVSL